MLLNALPVALVSESFGYLTERLAFRVNVGVRVVQLIVGLNDWIYGRTQGRKRLSSRCSKTFLGFSTCNERWQAAKPSHHTPID